MGWSGRRWQTRTSVRAAGVAGDGAQDQRRDHQPKRLAACVGVSVQFANTLFHAGVCLSCFEFQRWKRLNFTSLDAVRLHCTLNAGYDELIGALGEDGNAHAVEFAACLDGFRGVGEAGDEGAQFGDASLALACLEEGLALVQVREGTLALLGNCSRTWS